MPDWINSIKLGTSPFSNLQTWGRMAEPELRLRGSSRSQRQPLPVSDQQNQHPTDECVHILNHWCITTRGTGISQVLPVLVGIYHE